MPCGPSSTAISPRCREPTLRYAIEHFDEAERQHYLQLR